MQMACRSQLKHLYLLMKPHMTEARCLIEVDGGRSLFPDVFGSVAAFP